MSSENMKERSSISLWSLQPPFRVQYRKLCCGYRTCNNIVFTIMILVISTSQNLASYPKSNLTPEFASLKTDNSFQRTSSSEETHCSFPSQWHGSWFHLGFPKPLNISKDFIDSKGTCTQSNGARFIVGERSRDGKGWSCFKCMIIHQKHPNVLQYKESYCDSEFSGDIGSMCGSIESDSALFFMFRQQKNNNKTLDYNCPFDGVHTFSYSTRHGNAKCSQPPSHIDSCMDKTKMVFKFQACPDVPGSESSDEVLECVAGWKEGSSSYLIGRTRPLKRYDLTNSLHTNTRIGLLPSPLDKSHQSANPDSKYQCFRYEMHVEEGQFVTKMSQSKKGSCEGLWSAVEGDRTYTLKKVDTEIEECGLPHWLVSRKTWSNMDTSLRINTIKGSTRGVNMIVLNNKSNRSNAINQYWKARKNSRKERKGKGNWKKLYNNRRQYDAKIGMNEAAIESQITCHTLLKQNDVLDNQHQTSVKLIAYQKLGCTSGYICLEMKMLHKNIIHLKMGNQSRHSEEACTSHFFSSDNESGHLLIAGGSNEDCPFIGRYEKETTFNSTLSSQAISSWEQENTNKNDPGNEKCSEWIQSGCPLGSNMLINACPANKRKPSNNNYRQNKERKGRKRIAIHNQRIIDATCIGKWSQDSFDDRVDSKSSSSFDSEGRNTHDQGAMKKIVKSGQLTNMIIRGNNGISYCIQYRDQSRQILQFEKQMMSNDTKQDQMYTQKSLHIRIFARECPIMSHNVLLGSDQYSNKKRLEPRRELLSSRFSYEGPCQAALTDAASVSKASSNHMNFHLNGIFLVILVVILNPTRPVLYIFYPHAAS